MLCRPLLDIFESGMKKNPFILADETDSGER